MQQKQEEILKILLSLSEEEQNQMLLELNVLVKQDRIKRVWELEKEARRINWTLNGI